MSWTPAEDQAQYDTARALTREYGPLWLVLWSPSMRVYYAFWRGPGPVSPYRCADPTQLARQMRHARLAAEAGRAP